MLLKILLLLAVTSKASTEEAYRFIMENSYICLPPSGRFMTENEAKRNRCERICGKVDVTGLACIRGRSGRPLCVRVPTACIREYRLAYKSNPLRNKKITPTSRTAGSPQISSTAIRTSRQRPKAIQTTRKNNSIKLKNNLMNMTLSKQRVVRTRIPHEETPPGINHKFSLRHRVRTVQRKHSEVVNN
ncbi:hypothetical protein AB6A40_008270 [Gnathostoma spinigerum]|uniref:Secreted protein n=1 Tax=Gnathostoma spinigerum TaxID=75299 RepID=A0ABD6EP11_9BILA